MCDVLHSQSILITDVTNHEDITVGRLIQTVRLISGTGKICRFVQSVNSEVRCNSSCLYKRLTFAFHALRMKHWSTKSCHDMTWEVTVFQLRSPLGGDAYIRSPSWPSPDIEYHIMACPRPNRNTVTVPGTVRRSSYTTKLRHIKDPIHSKLNCAV